MKKKSVIFIVLLVLVVWCWADKPKQEGIEGIWEGVLKTQAVELRIVVKISKAEDGKLKATMDSPDQGAKDIGIDTITLEKNQLKFEVKIVNGHYEGTINTDFTGIDGKWTQSGMSLPLLLKHVEKESELIRPQEPRKPYPYKEEEVTYENKKAGIKLAGTLTYPPTEGPFPAVILITGSGLQDRNETVMGHRPFLVISDYLTRRGIAVLRVDDRGVGGSTGNIIESTSLDFVGDVLAGIEFLKKHGKINPKKIGLIGHSEGGVIAPMVAAQSGDVSLIVLLAGTGLTGEEILYLQGALILRANGSSEEVIKRERELQERVFKLIKEGGSNDQIEAKLRKLYAEEIAKLSEEEKKQEELSEAQIQTQLKQVLSPWFRYFLTYDPKPTLEKVKCPVLALVGEKDLQVPPKQNLKAIEDALKKGGNKNFTVEELPGLNHLFQHASTGSPGEYTKIEETFSEDALKIIGDWILEQTKKIPFTSIHGSGKGNVQFDAYFQDKTMRLDYFHSGTAQEEHFAIDRILADGKWGGSKTILIDQLNLGSYQFDIMDKESDTLLYSRGFASVYGEWETTAEAKKQWGTFHESIRFPWPKKIVKVALKKRDKQNKFVEIWHTEINPGSRQVTPADLVNTNNIFTIMENGPAEKKVDIVVLGDGYTKEEMDKFHKDAQRLISVLFSVEPYKSRKADFNIRAIDTPSPVSGVNRPHPGIFKRTPLSVHYSSFDLERYALTYDNRRVRDTASAVPYEFTVILINERTYGGGGIYRLYATVAADNAFSDYIIIHELGHHIAGLADEYYTSRISYEIDSKVTVEPWELNITALLDKDNLKWKDLVKPGTPLPTPWNKKEYDEFSISIQDERQRLRNAKAKEEELETLFQRERKMGNEMFSRMKYVNQVGAFEGASYLAKGLYRPSINCIMFSRYLKFCPVCQRSLNLVIDQYTQ
jgi:pimeloyl-ACP methyl ester carboxylesterase